MAVPGQGQHGEWCFLPEAAALLQHLHLEHHRFSWSSCPLPRKILAFVTKVERRQAGSRFPDPQSDTVGSSLGFLFASFIPDLELKKTEIQKRQRA